MKRIFFLILLMNTLVNVLAQSVATPYPSILQTPFFTDHDLISKEKDIEGSPLLFEDWRLGTVILKDHIEYDSVRLNFIPSTNKFYFGWHDTVYELVNTVAEIRIKDFSHPDDRNYDMVFKNTLHVNDVMKPGTFVEVLTNGKIVVFKEYIKQAAGENSTNGIVASVKKYVLHTNIFAIADNKTIRVKPNAHFLKELTSDRQDQMKAFLKSKELNLRKEADFKQAVSYYNYICSLSFSKKIPI